MQKEHRDLSSSEISSLVYNTRSVKPHVIKPLWSSEERESSLPLTNVISSQIKDDVLSSADPPNEQPSPAKHPSNPNHNPNPSVIREKREAVQENQRLFSKLNSLLLRRVERPEHAQSIVAVLKKLRKSFSVEEIVESHINEHHFLIPLVSSCDFFMKYEELVEETLAFILPLARPKERRQILIDDMLSSGAFLFCFASLRHYLTNPNIRSLALELLVCSLEFILELASVNSISKEKKYANQSFVVHELVLHGGTTFLPSLLATFHDCQSEIGVRRVLKCIKFLILRTTVQVAQTIASVNHFSLVRNCLSIVRNSTIESQIDAAIILTGLSACSLLVSEKLMEFGGWDDVRTLLANPTLNFSGGIPSVFPLSSIEMPSSWLEKSTKSMKIIYLKHSSHFPESGSSFDWEMDINSQGETISKEPPSNSETQKVPLSPSPLSILPNSYWLTKDQPKSRVRLSSANSTLPRCKDRLLNSPFGDPRKLIKIQQKKALQARAAQAKYRNSTKTPLPVVSSSQDCKPSKKSKEELPIDVQKHVVIAEKLFGEKGEIAGGETATPSAVDQLSYEERLTVMMMQIKNESYESLCS